MKNIIFLVLVLCSTTTITYSQKSDHVELRDRGVGISITNCHFFDGTPTHWGLLVEHRGKNKLPFRFDLSYYWNNKNVHDQYQISLIAYYTGYAYGRTEDPGYVFERAIGVLSFGYLNNLAIGKSNRVDALFETNFRFGYESNHLAYSQWFESRVHNHLLSDIGLTVGVQAKQKIFWRINLIGGIKYTRYVFRLNNGKPPEFDGDTGSSKNTLTIKLGLAFKISS